MKYWRWYVRLVLLLLIVGQVLYALFVERHHIEVTHQRISLPDWPGTSVRLAVLSDLHARPDEEEYLRRVVEKTLEQKPDVVLLLGDYVNGRGDTMPLDKLESILKPLTQLPCFAVWGNHDYWYGRRHLRPMFHRLGIPMMEGKIHELSIGGARLHIAGARCAFTFLHPGNIPQPRPDIPYILLSHSPAIAHHAPEGVEMILSGHTHGGQVCLPFYGAIRMPDHQVDREKCAGRQTIDGKPLYISRGIGTSQIPVRYWCRPEIAILELVGIE